MPFIAQGAITITYEAMGICLLAFSIFHTILYFIVRSWIRGMIAEMVDRVAKRIPRHIWTVAMMEVMRLDFINQNPGSKVRSAYEIYNEHIDSGSGMHRKD